MKLRALNTIQRAKEVIAPGQEFDADTKEAEYLIFAGAAIAVEEPEKKEKGKK